MYSLTLYPTMHYMQKHALHAKTIYFQQRTID